MNAEEMHALACRYALSPTEENLEKALEACMPLCEMIARRFSGRGVEYEDLRQTAALAAIGALKSFDAEKGLRFTTYVTPTITGKVRNFLRDKSELLHAPRTVKEQRGQLIRARSAFADTHHREPSVKELSEMLSWPQDKVMDTLNAMNAGRVISLSTPDEEGKTLEEKLADPSDELEKSESRADLTRAMEHLSEKERGLLRMRYSQNMSQRDIGAQLGMTQMQVSRAEKRILSTLRRLMEAS